MDKNIFLKYKESGEAVTILVKPELRLTGHIIEIYDDSFQFRTRSRDSILDYDMIGGIVEVTNNRRGDRNGGA